MMQFGAWVKNSSGDDPACQPHPTHGRTILLHNRCLICVTFNFAVEVVTFEGAMGEDDINTFSSFEPSLGCGAGLTCAWPR